MDQPNPILPPGYSAVPHGMLATTVTFLEMRARPEAAVSTVDPAFSFRPAEKPDPGFYRDLFRRVGEDWLWMSRLRMGDEELCATIHHHDVAVHVLSRDGEAMGLAELDFRQKGACEIVYFGLAGEAIGKGVGRFMMGRAIGAAWARPIDRLWLHTCHLDHPAALGFYRRMGFRPYATMVEVLEDPRLAGVLPRSAAPHVPLLG